MTGTSRLGMFQSQPSATELVPATLHTVPEAIGNNIAIARARTHSQIIALLPLHEAPGASPVFQVHPPSLPLRVLPDSSAPSAPSKPSHSQPNQMPPRKVYSSEFKLETLRLLKSRDKTKADLERPNEKWVGDNTYIATKEGWLYLAAMLDIYSRKVMGWAMGKRMEEWLVASALQMATIHRCCSSMTLT